MTFSHVIRESKVYQRTILKNSKSLSTPWLFIYISLFSADCIRRNKCLDGNPSKETDSENWQRCALQCFNDINGECFNWSFFEGKCSLFTEETRTEITKSGCISGTWDCYQWNTYKIVQWDLIWNKFDDVWNIWPKK